MSVIFFGDPHFDAQTPVSRIDNYAEASLQRLKDILSLAKQNQVQHVMTTGDFFDKYEVSFTYLNEIISVLKDFEKENIIVWSLIGNHDLPYNNMSYFKNTPLNTLFTSGLVRHLKKFNEFEDFNVYGIDFTNAEAIKDMQVDKSKTNILIMHYATENTVPGESINEGLEKFDFVISGHDHMYYPLLILDSGTKVFRPGSLLRRTKEAYNLTRDIVICLFKDKAMTEVKLPNVKPAAEIFRNEAFETAKLNLYDNKYNELFNKDYFEDNASDILSILNSNILPVTVNNDSKEAIKRYLKSQGIT